MGRFLRFVVQHWRPATRSRSDPTSAPSESFAKVVRSIVSTPSFLGDWIRLKYVCLDKGRKISQE